MVANWFTLTRAGFTALRKRDGAGVAGCWTEALLAADALGPDHAPLGVIAGNNVLSACAGTGEMAAVPALAARLKTLWDGLDQRVEQEDIVLPARSSAFHLALASRHGPAYSAFLRQHYRARARLGRQLAQQAMALKGPHDGQPFVSDAPDFHLEAMAALRAGRLDPGLALAVLERQIVHLDSIRQGGGLPLSFWKQLDLVADLSVFGPLVGVVLGLADAGRKDGES